MDGPDRRHDDIDNLTYRDVILPTSVDSSLISGLDWRGPATAPSPRRARVARSPATPRATGLREERDRARTIVAEAKIVIEGTFDAVRFGSRIEPASLTPLITAIAQSIERNPIAIPSVTRLKTRSEDTHLHSAAVCGLMIARLEGSDQSVFVRMATICDWDRLSDALMAFEPQA